MSTPDDEIYASDDEVADEVTPAPGTVPDPYQGQDWDGVQDSEVVEDDN